MTLLDSKLTNILEYIKENPKSDPNAYEMNDVMFEMADIGFFGRKFESEAYDFLHDQKYKELKDKFYQMMEYRIPQFTSVEQALDATNLYDYFNESLKAMATLNRLYYDTDHEATKNMFNSICGVNLYVHQRVRDLGNNQAIDEVIYDNEYENTKNILAWENYLDPTTQDGPRPYDRRDNITKELYDEIQNTYQTTLSEKRTNKKESVK